MDNRQIHYFTEVVRQGGFSKREYLYVSQPTISNVVKDLEKELDVQLLIRTTRKLELTDTGKLLFIMVKKFPNYTDIFIKNWTILKRLIKAR